MFSDIRFFYKYHGTPTSVRLAEAESVRVQELVRDFMAGSAYAKPFVECLVSEAADAPQPLRRVMINLEAIRCVEVFPGVNGEGR